MASDAGPPDERAAVDGEPAPARAPAARRDPKKTSAAILAAAVREFTDRGYAGARVDEIARRAGANKRMLYHYFGNKEALYVAVLEHAYGSIRSAEQALRLSERDPIEGMTELVRFTWRYYLAHPEFLSLINTEDLLKAKYLKRSARILDLNSPLVPQIAALIRRGERDGAFRPGLDPLRVYLSIASLGVFYLAHRWTLSTIFGRELGSHEELDAWERHMIDATLASLHPPSMELAPPPSQSNNSAVTTRRSRSR